MKTTDLFPHDWYISENSECNGNFVLDYAWFNSWEIFGEHRKLFPAEPNCVGK